MCLDILILCENRPYISAANITQDRLQRHFVFPFQNEDDNCDEFYSRSETPRHDVNNSTS